MLLALGFATLVAPTDSPCIVVAWRNLLVSHEHHRPVVMTHSACIAQVKDDAVGVRISGIMLEAGDNAFLPASDFAVKSAACLSQS